MENRDQRIDAVIEAAAPFAQPVLMHLRELVHAVCPQVEEKIKWGMPFFDYKGPMCHMAAFKAHCAFGFWKSALMTGFVEVLQAGQKDSMGDLGKIKSLDDLPPDDVLMAMIAEACRLNEEGIKLPSKEKAARRDEPMDQDLLAALQLSDAAMLTFEKFSPSHRREYNLWIREAKTEATKQKRIATAIEWMSEGKSRDWKYMKKKS